MTLWYDKEGRPLDQESAAILISDWEYKRVATTDVGPYWVSTVWLGLDHNFMGEGPPVLFETMVFAKGQRDDPEDHGLSDIDCVRYCTEEEALAGHEEMVLLIEATLQEVPDVQLRAGSEDGPVDEEGGPGDPGRHQPGHRGRPRRGGPGVQQRRPGDGDPDPG